MDYFYYFLIYVVLVILLLWWKDTYFSNIPGPRGWPLLGSVPTMLYHSLKGDHLDAFARPFDIFGKIFQLGIFGIKRIVFIADLEDLKHFFHSPNFVKGEMAHDVMHDIFGEGIFNTDGDNWRIQRQTASALFHFNNLQAFVPVFFKRAQVLNSILANHAKSGKSVDVQKLFMRYTIDAIGELGYGISIDALKENKEALEFADSFDYVQAKTAKRFMVHPAWKLLPSPVFKSKIKEVDVFMTAIVEQRKQEVADGVDISDRVDLLSRFLSAKDETGKQMFSDKYLLDVVKNFLIAGRDTTAVCLTWTFYLLAMHPEVEQKLLDEIATVIGDTSTNLTYDKLKDLKYMKHVIDESLRLYPPIPMDQRCAVETETLPSGHVLPAGTFVVYPAYAIHRMPDYWNDPLKFNPDRWETDVIKPYQFVPFHGGPRICLGQNMAYLEIKVVLAAVLPFFKFRVVNPNKVKYTHTLSLPTKYGVEMHVYPRASM